MTKKTNLEYGGWLYQRQDDSKFSYSGPIEGQVDKDGRSFVKPGPVPAGEIIVKGAYHSHPHRNSDDNNDFSNNEGESDIGEARAWTQRFECDMYMALGCPNGRIRGLIVPYVHPQEKVLQISLPWPELK